MAKQKKTEPAKWHLEILNLKYSMHLYGEFFLKNGIQALVTKISVENI